MALALVFPGQGAQTIGMGRDLAETYPEAKAVFDAVDDALGEKLSQLIWEGEADDLTLTANAQPALMATSLAAFAALKAEGFDISRAAMVAGHSLGEYSALAAAGALSVPDAARLLRLRGQAMQEAVPVGEGAMAALLGLDFEAARQIAEDAAQGPHRACFNAPATCARRATNKTLVATWWAVFIHSATPVLSTRPGRFCENGQKIGAKPSLAA